MRGQTTLDFATGVSVFLLTVLFVFIFVPGILTPFTQTAQEETVTANRVADLVTKDIVADPAEPYLLDGPCTAALLNGTYSAGSDCGFDGSTLEARLDLDQFQSVNITLRGSPSHGGNELMCWDATNAAVVNQTASRPCTASDVFLLQAGEDVPDNRGSVVTARRVASLEGTVVSVEVRVW
ncbi:MULTISPECIES: DUF7287 family protein [Salinibaculum]|uniref:DUF7287 family protein n=1 Tax=Salinibaculum TaxID=2732368 RepID=UPI0030CBFFA0